jgi:outer membrane protein assembly factor BamB
MTIEARPTSTVTWAEGPAEYTSTDPAAKKTVGYASSEVPAYEHLNWILREAYKWIRYLRDRVEAKFTEVYDAIDAGHVYPDTFQLYSAQIQNGQGDIDNSFRLMGGRGATIETLVTDGRLLYAISDELAPLYDVIVAQKPNEDTTTPEWTYALLAGAARSLCADGRHVYLGVDPGVGVIILDPTDGSVVTTYKPLTHVVDEPIQMVANGRYLCVIEDATPDAIEVIYLPGTDPVVPAAVDTIDLTGCTDIYMALHGDYLAVAYVDGTSDATVELYLLSAASVTLVWQITASVAFANNCTPSAIAMDADRIYLLTDHFEILAGVSGSVHAFRKTDCARLWTATNGTDDAVACALSSGMIHVSMDHTTEHQMLSIDAALGELRYWRTGTLGSAVMTADELCYYVRVGDDDTKYARVWHGGPSKIMQVASPIDPHRNPNPHVAVPVK